MTHANGRALRSLGAACALAVLVDLLPGGVAAASINFVQTSRSATQRTYDLIASAEFPVTEVRFNSNFGEGEDLVTSMTYQDCSGFGTMAPPCFFELGSFSYVSAGGVEQLGFDLGLASLDTGAGWSDATIAAWAKSGVYGRLTVNHSLLGGRVITLKDAGGSFFDGGNPDESSSQRFIISPEPGILVLIGLILVGLALSRRSRGVVSSSACHRS